MDKQTVITLDQLGVDSVSVITETQITVDGSKYILNRSRKAYTNSIIGRRLISAELPAAQATAVFAVWGNNPTVEDPEPPYISEA